MLLGSLLSSVILPANAQNGVSRVYVTAYGCTAGSARPESDVGTPTVSLFEKKERNELTPATHAEARMLGAMRFYFDVAPGYYELSLIFHGKEICGSNGPLVVIEGASRHLFVVGGNGVTDWHAELAIAGTVPIKGLSVRAVLLDRAAKCGDDPRGYGVKESDGTVDDGVYYANLMAYDRQDHTIALVLTGALFSERTILITQPLGGPSHARDLVVKSLSQSMLQVAASAPNAFSCVPGF
jgi:hypothetical protein